MSFKSRRLDKTDSGVVFINGKETGSLSDYDESVMRRSDIGFVFQAYNLIDNLTVEENVLYPPCWMEKSEAR